MSNSDRDAILDALAAKDGHDTPGDLSSEEIACLLTAFVPPDSTTSLQQSQTLQSKGYVALSEICRRSRQTKNDGEAGNNEGTVEIVKKFAPDLESKLRDVEETPLLEAVSFLTALFTVDWAAAAAIFCRDGVQDMIMDTFELFPSSTQLPRAVGSLLAQACGYRQCRAALSPRCQSWLETQLKATSEPAILASAALSLLKRSLGKEQNSVPLATPSGDESSLSIDYDALLNSMKTALMNPSDDPGVVAEAVEGFVYLTSIPSIKETIVADSALLRKLISLRPRVLPRDARTLPDEQTTISLSYGLAVIFSNLCAYPPKLTEEESRVQKLQRAAHGKSSKDAFAKADAEALLDDDDHVRRRCRILIQAGVVELFVSISRVANRPAIREIVGKAFLDLVTDQANRGKVLQDGGSKALGTIIRSSLESTSNTTTSSGNKDLKVSDLLAIQALAKLCITASPLHVFGPNEGQVHDAIRPFSNLLLNGSSSQLQQFEALMALTNLAGLGPETANRIATSDGLISKVEFLLLDDNEMVRRAATEIICNLASECESVFKRYSGEGGEGSSRGIAKSRLQILVSLADVDDVQTRLAASGALAILTESPSACDCLLSLQRETEGVLRIFSSLIYPSDEDYEASKDDFGLQHRGIICLKNFLLNQKDLSSKKELAEQIKKAGLVETLVEAAKAASKDQERAVILRPIAEVLQCLADSGVKVF